MALAICSCLEKCGASGDKPRNFLLTQCYVSDSYYYSAADMVVEYCDESVCVGVCVCLSAIIFLELHIRLSPNVLCMLPIAIAQSFSGSILIRYVLPVLWMTSYFLGPRLLDVAAQLKRSAHTALGLAVNCAQ